MFDAEKCEFQNFENVKKFTLILGPNTSPIKYKRVVYVFIKLGSSDYWRSKTFPY